MGQSPQQYTQYIWSIRTNVVCLCIGLYFLVEIVLFFVFFFFSSRRRHTRCREVSWARRCVQETGINAEYMGGRDAGHVAVFEDITELEKIQRLAAWREVARRIAHEIKNPLTPIKLSAQRLQRKYGCLLYTSPSPRDLSTSRMPSSA
eukprot:TRINITY_DN11309_c0_g1_i3.p2 TRINITY_DN11309_c0_g1~~TRINITY_DN11309_c0_g1_i3.p2  ORF type:complete len:148 (+),score=56.37 TRINITY_DN11309_c0_g1_i3:2-445(+)